MIILQGAKELIELLCFAPDGRGLVAVPEISGHYTSATRLHLWDEITPNGRPSRFLDYRVARCVRYTPDGRRLLLTGYADYPRGRRQTFLHDLATDEVIALPLEGERRWGYCALIPEGQFLLIAERQEELDQPGLLSCRSLRTPTEPLWIVETPRDIHGPLLPLPGGTHFVVPEHDFTALRGHVLVTRERATGNIVFESRHKGGYLGEIIDPTGRWIAAYYNNRIGIYHGANFAAEPIVLNNDSRKAFTGLAFHPSGRYLAATSNDATVKLYDTETWTVAKVFTWEIGRLRSIAFSPDGMLAAAGSDKGKIIVWDFDL